VYEERPVNRLVVIRVDMAPQDELASLAAAKVSDEGFAVFAFILGMDDPPLREAGRRSMRVFFFLFRRNRRNLRAPDRRTLHRGGYITSFRKELVPHS